MSRMDIPKDDWDDLLPPDYEWVGEEYDIIDGVDFDPDFLFELEMFLFDEEPDAGA